MTPEQLLGFINTVEDYALIALDTDLNIQYCNRGTELLFRSNAEECKGKTFDFLFPPEHEDDHMPKEIFTEAGAGKKAIYEGWLNRQDKTKFLANVSVTAGGKENGNVIGYTLIIKDVTGQREREDYIKNIEDRHYRMINEVKDYAILLLSPQGIVQNWNKGAERLKGYKAEEIIGKSFEIFYPETDIKNNLPQTLLQEARENGRAQREGWRIKKDGSKFWGNITITALHDESGNIIGFSKVTRDLTERMLAELNQKKYLEQLEVKNKELEQIVYITSHDLQEPLRTMISFINLFTEEATTKIQGHGAMYLKFIKEAAERMSHFIKTLLDYARLGREGRFSEIDVNEVLRDIVSDLTLLIKNTNAEITVGPLPKIWGYRIEMQQLFQNLISNAIKFMKSGTPPKIDVRASVKEEYYEFDVSDNGIGIDPAHHEKIFMIFQRLHSRNDYEGTGIGLANCKKIVELHGGRLWVNSLRGKGSTFSFTIPRRETLAENR